MILTGRSTRMTSPIGALVMLCALGLAAPVTLAAGFGVSPIRVELDRDSRTASITVSNDDAERKLEMQARLFEWTQDAEGRDIYTESNDLVFFPRIFSIEKKDQRVIRVGLKVPAASVEKAYRLYIEELPAPRDPRNKGAQVSFVLRFGVPVLVEPPQGRAVAAIERVDSEPGKLVVVVSNRGNQNFRIDSLRIRSSGGFEKEAPGGYVHASVSKRLAFDIPQEGCRTLGELRIVLKTDRAGEVERSFPWDASHCRTP